MRVEVYDEKPFELNKALFETVAACNYDEAEQAIDAIHMTSLTGKGAYHD